MEMIVRRLKAEGKPGCRTVDLQSADCLSLTKRSSLAARVLRPPEVTKVQTLEHPRPFHGVLGFDRVWGD